MALNHRQKVKLAHRLLGDNEEYPGIFNSLGWRQRKWQIQQRVRRQEIRRKYHKEVKQGVR